MTLAIDIIHRQGLSHKAHCEHVLSIYFIVTRWSASVTTHVSGQAHSKVFEMLGFRFTVRTLV